MIRLLNRQQDAFARLSFYCVWLLAFALLITGCTAEKDRVDYMAILSRVHEGDDRQRALQMLSDAWYHSECILNAGVIEDIFLFGPKNRDKVTIISILSEPRGDRLIVYQTGTFENYFLDSPDFGKFCRPPVREAFD